MSSRSGKILLCSRDGFRKPGRIGMLGPRSDEHPFEPGFGCRFGESELAICVCAFLVGAHGPVRIVRATEEFRFEPEELGELRARQRVALGVERLDAALRARDTPEKQIGVREVQECLPHRPAATRAPAHVDRGLETLDGTRYVATDFQEPGKVRLRHREDPRVPCRLGRRDGALVSNTCAFDVVRPLQK